MFLYVHGNLTFLGWTNLSVFILCFSRFWMSLKRSPVHSLWGEISPVIHYYFGKMQNVFWSCAVYVVMLLCFSGCNWDGSKLRCRISFFDWDVVVVVCLRYSTCVFWDVVLYICCVWDLVHVVWLGCSMCCVFIGTRIDQTPLPFCSMISSASFSSSRRWDLAGSSYLRH